MSLLSIIEQDVPKMSDFGLPLPHMGWNRVYPQAEIVCSVALKMARISTLYTAMLCR